MTGQATPPTLLLTRPQAASERFLSVLEARLGQRVPSVISPVLAIEPVGDLPDIGDETLIFTSANGVEIAGASLTLIGRAVLTVGARTAEVARQAGADARCLGDSVETFLAAADGIDGPCLHLRGTHARGDLAGRLTGAGIPTREQVIYDQRALPPSSAARALLSGTSPVLLPLFSPRSATLVRDWCGDDARVNAIAISPAVAEAWGAESVPVAQNPSAEAMLEAVAVAFHRPRLGGTPPTH